MAGPHNVTRHFPVGAPSRQTIARKARVVEVRQEAEGILGLTLEDAHGRPLPKWSAGAHVELCVGDFDRKYSLCGAPDTGTYQVAILREEQGRGGSRHIHETIRAGDEIKLRGPSNLFRLDDKVYLIGSIREDTKIHYWYADDIGGPFMNFADNVLLPKGNYAARVCKVGDRWLLFNFFQRKEIIYGREGQGE